MLVHFCFFGLHSKLKDGFFPLVVFALPNREQESKHAPAPRWPTSMFWSLLFDFFNQSRRSYFMEF